MGQPNSPVKPECVEANMRSPAVRDYEVVIGRLAALAPSSSHPQFVTATEVRILGASPEALIAKCRSGFSPAIFQVERDYRGIKPLLHPTTPKQASGYGTH
jgi:hypothetical protein